MLALLVAGLKPVDPKPRFFAKDALHVLTHFPRAVFISAPGFDLAARRTKRRAPANAA